MSKTLPMTPHERAKRLFDEAERLGLERPTEDMTADAINAAEFSAVLHTGGQAVLEKWLSERNLEAHEEMLKEDTEEPPDYSLRVICPNKGGNDWPCPYCGNLVAIPPADSRAVVSQLCSSCGEAMLVHYGQTNTRSKP